MREERGRDKERYTEVEGERAREGGVKVPTSVWSKTTHHLGLKYVQVRYTYLFSNTLEWCAVLLLHPSSST